MKELCKAFYKLRNHKKGFTLVEIVIVIAIIGILSAILIPTLINYVKEAKRTSMINDTRIAVKTFNEAMINIYAKGGGINAVHNIEGQKRGAITNYTLYRAQRHNDRDYLDGKGNPKSSYSDYKIARALLDVLESSTSHDPRYAFNYPKNPAGLTFDKFLSLADRRDSCGMLIVYNADGSLHLLQFATSQYFCEYRYGDITIYDAGDPSAKFINLSFA